MTKQWILAVLTVLVATTAHAAVVDLEQAVIPSCYMGMVQATCTSDASSASVSLVVLPEYDALANANETIYEATARVLADNGQQLYFGRPRLKKLQNGPTRVTLHIPRRVIAKVDAYRQEWVQVIVYIAGQDLGVGKDRPCDTHVADTATVWMLFNPDKPMLPPPPPPPPRPTCTLEAYPQTIHVGESAKLTWTSHNASVLTLSGVGVVAVNGSTYVEPRAPTGYVLSASSAGGTTTCQTVVAVSP